MSAQEAKRYQCTNCGYVYKAKQHHQKTFDQQPAEWTCPGAHCGQPYKDFKNLGDGKHRCPGTWCRFVWDENKRPGPFPPVEGTDGCPGKCGEGKSSFVEI